MGKIAAHGGASNQGTLITTSPIPASLLDAKGDLIVGLQDDVPARLAVGADGKVLTADSTSKTGLKWAAAGSSATFSVMDYGAKGDGSTDDTAAINACIAAAFAAQTANGVSYAEIYFPPGEYVVSSATTKGGAGQGNAQIPLPNVATTAEKFTLVFTGVRDATAWVHWEQTVAQRSGSVIRSTLTSQASDGTWGAPSIIGGPTISQGTGIFSNVKVVIDGLTVMAPYNPSLVAVDLRYCAQAHIRSLACLANAPAVGSPAITTRPTDSLGMGLRVPQNGNNDAVLVDDYGCQGFYYGISAGEHLTGLRIALVYVAVGIFFSVGGGSFHGGTIVNLSIEAAGTGLQTSGTSGASWPLHIAQMAVESVDTHVDDANSVLHGLVFFTDTLDAGPTISGAAHLKIIDVSQKGQPGAKTAPGVPATTVALTNPFWRDCGVIITGGAVTVVKVDGVTTGLTPPCTVPVPSGKTIALTYTVAPTWVWIAL